MRQRNAIIDNKRDEFCKVALSDFIQFPDLEYDVFMRTSSDRFMKVGNANSQLPSDRLQSFLELGLQYLYVRQTDIAFEVV